MYQLIPQTGYFLKKTLPQSTIYQIVINLKNVLF